MLHLFLLSYVLMYIRDEINNNNNNFFVYALWTFLRPLYFFAVRAGKSTKL